MSPLTVDEPKTPYSMLDEAVASGNLDLVKIALKQGASVEETYQAAFRTGQQESILQRAAGSGHVGVVQTLLNQGASTTINNGLQSPLSIAIEKGHTACVKVLLAAGANIYGDAPFNSLGNGPVCQAVVAEHEDILRILLARDFDVNYNHVGSRALTIAIDLESETMVRMLLERGVSVERVEDDLFKADLLRHAVDSGQLGISKLLVAYGAKTDGVVPEEWTEEQFTKAHEQAQNSY